MPLMALHNFKGDRSGNHLSLSAGFPCAGAPVVQVHPAAPQPAEAALGCMAHAAGHSQQLLTQLGQPVTSEQLVQAIPKSCPPLLPVNSFPAEFCLPLTEIRCIPQT